MVVNWHQVGHDGKTHYERSRLFGLESGEITSVPRLAGSSPSWTSSGVDVSEVPIEQWRDHRWHR